MTLRRSGERWGDTWTCIKVKRETMESVQDERHVNQGDLLNENAGEWHDRESAHTPLAALDALSPLSLLPDEARRGRKGRKERKEQREDNRQSEKGDLACSRLVMRRSITSVACHFISIGYRSFFYFFYFFFYFFVFCVFFSSSSSSPSDMTDLP